MWRGCERASATPATRLALLALLALLANAAAAQDCVDHPTSDPTLGACNSIPLGAAAGHPTLGDQRTQFLIPAARLGAQPIGITELAFAPCGNGVRHFDRIVVRIGQTTNLVLDSNFANNFAQPPTTVLDMRDHRYVERAAQWQPLGLTGIHSFDPARGNVVVEITIAGAGLVASGPGGPGHRSGGVARVYAYGFGTQPPSSGFVDDQGPHVRICTTAGFVDAFGTGCGAPLRLTGSGRPNVGGHVDLVVRGGAPAAAATYLIGFHGGPTYPLDLGVLRMDGCTLHVAIAAVVGATLSPLGDHRLTLTIPAAARLTSARIHVQAAALQPGANPFGLVVSDYVRILIGR